MKYCYFCKLELEQKYIYNIREKYTKQKLDNKKCIFFLPELRKYSCIDCGNNYYIFKFSNNKLNFLKKREHGIKIKLNKSKNIGIYKKEHCVICDKILDNITIYTPVNSREKYIIGIGQFCSDCYSNFA
mgnify:CR=1 FL=1|jgi:hypothetical protein